MITIKTCANVSRNRDFANPATPTEKMVHLLSIDGRINEYYAAMMIEAAELGTFYAADLFDAFAEVWRASWSRWSNQTYSDEFVQERYSSGAYMNAWRINGLISPTGNEREVRINLYDDVYRIVKAKEWRANFTPEQVQKVLSALYDA